MREHAETTLRILLGDALRALDSGDERKIADALGVLIPEAVAAEQAAARRVYPEPARRRWMLVEIDES